MEILNSLGINFTAVIWHAVNFLILVAVLQRFLYRPVIRALDERAARIRDAMAQAEATRAETERLQQESATILERARRQAQEIVAQANRTSERVLSEAREHARQEGDRLVERARADLVRERDQVFQELREQLADIVVTAAGRVIRRSLDDSAHREIVREVLTSERRDN